MKELFVCEKPSQAEDYAKALSGGGTRKNGYFEGNDGRVYTYAFGHLVKCVNPDQIDPDFGWKGDPSNLPFFLRDIPLQVIDDAGVKKQYKIILDLMKQAELIYCSTDAGREGQHIFSKICLKGNIKNKKVMRLWVRDQTESGIKKAFQEAKDNNEYAGLTLAGKLREESDMLIGLNATQLLTKLSNSPSVLSLGRVQTPTLAMIVKRDYIIENFKKVKHFTIVAPVMNLEKDSTKLFEMVLEKDEQLTQEDAQARLALLGNRTDYSVTSERGTEKPRKLFSLTSLQVYMNKKIGWSASKTLEVLQKLYDKKFVTYPRTSSEYIANDEELPGLLACHVSHEWVKSIIENGWKIEKTFVDPSKVSDHEAIIITTEQPSGLNPDEKRLYDEIFLRFVSAFYPAAVFEKTTASFQDGPETFKATEKVLREQGWLALEHKEVQESILKTIKLDNIGDYLLKEKETKPPARYTEGTILEDMEKPGKFIEGKESKAILKKAEGIGTTATRAQILETLKKRKFIEENGKHLISTKLGRTVIMMMPPSFSLYSAELTAEFETSLAQIERNEKTEKEFYDELENLIGRIAAEIRANIKNVQGAVKAATAREVIVKCPKCGKPIYENTKSFSCSGYKDGCEISLWKNGLEKLGKKNITKNEAKKLLSGHVVKVKLKSAKTGNPYDKEVRFNTEKCWIEFAK
ncbi:DNA topoisomerase III [Bacillus thuringiensis]|uniref:DNA topoisomerase n=1 Tax=Bacillus thuringiensis TaxID=1428 RepID=UPI002853CE41|nr:DNA topoisomerase [Bacillus thuringiensis]MDR5025374.1 DNA topoisomerase III [Bacillus thuringiensis]